MGPARIRRLYLADHPPFHDVLIDLTGPDGRAVRRACFIGRNGTGKTRLLRKLGALVGPVPSTNLRCDMAAEVEIAGGTQRWFYSAEGAGGCEDVGRSSVSLEAAFRAWQGSGAAGEAGQHQRVAEGDLVVHSGAESSVNQGLALSGSPQARLGDALADDDRAVVGVDAGRIDKMWGLLIRLVEQRRQAREAFENAPENLDRTKRELVEAFDATHPDPLAELGALWDRILAPAGLALDLAGVRLPVQLSDTLEAHVVSVETGQAVPYNALSTGIRNVLFRVGHLKLLYLARDVRRGFVLVDEPEASLYPDFLFELMGVFDDICGDATQQFYATHSPIVAAHFEPFERIVLDFEAPGRARARKGTAPIGDDPNDLLRQDFQLAQLMGPEGLEAHRRYVELRTQLRRAAEEDKGAILEEAAELGRRYGFGA